MGENHDSPGSIEWLDPEGDDDVLEIEPHARRPWRRWAPLIALVLAGIVAAVIVSRHGGNTRPSANTPSPTQWVPVPSAVRTDAAGQPILGITGDYELLARGPTTLVRVQFAEGHVIMTGLPGLASSGPVSFVVGAQRAIIRPLDFVPGYEVGGGPIQTLGGLLSNGGPAMPGADAKHLWIEQRDDSGGSADTVLRLVDFSGRPEPESIRINDGYELIGPDGAGYVLLSRDGVLYDAHPDGLTRIASGNLLATGPTGWLVRSCDRETHCTSTYVDRRTGSHHRLPKDVYAPFGPPTWGVISPDGTTAAIATDSKTDGPVVTLIDLHTGDDHPIPHLPMTSGQYENQLAFSPDGRWLFMAGATLLALDVTTRIVHTIGNLAPSLSLTQLAVRPTSEAGSP